VTTYTLFWLDGTNQVVTGDTFLGAVIGAGYRSEVVKTLDFYMTGDNKDYAWNPTAHTWDKINMEKKSTQIYTVSGNKDQIDSMVGIRDLSWKAMNPDQPNRVKHDCENKEMAMWLYKALSVQGGVSFKNWLD
jgi:hypothetical protein